MPGGAGGWSAPGDWGGRQHPPLLADQLLSGPVFVHFHGNGETAQGCAGPLSVWPQLYAEAGASAVLFAEYRGYSGSGGCPSLCRMQDDQPALVAAAGAPPEDLVLYGRSMGSVFALAAAARFPGVRGLVLESGIARLDQWCARGEEDEAPADPAARADAVAKWFDSSARLRAYQGPLLILHTQSDRVVPVSSAEEFASMAEDGKAGRAKLIVWPSGGHNQLHFANYDALEAALRDFVAATNPRG
mmetsp:Transcript_144803/g.403473  ORF Transcript_144803/g.403473 Transcript_144803/m.403473 type:complete len:245 (+) Transcript_144803:2-736(+)